MTVPALVDDVERARAWLGTSPGYDKTGTKYSEDDAIKSLATEFATVRREAIEECAKVADAVRLLPEPRAGRIACEILRSLVIQAIRSKLSGDK